MKSFDLGAARLRATLKLNKRRVRRIRYAVSLFNYLKGVWHYRILMFMQTKLLLAALVAAAPLSPANAQRASVPVPQDQRPKVTQKQLALCLPEPNRTDNSKYSILSGHTPRTQNEIVQAGYFSSATLLILQKQKGANFQFEIAIHCEPNNEGAVFGLAPTALLKGPTPGSFSNRPIGARSWVLDRVLDIEDGWIMMTVKVMPTITRDEERRPHFGPVTEDDLLWAENEARRILHRATVLGLTTTSPEKAPTWAKDELQKRLRAVPPPGGG